MARRRKKKQPRIVKDGDPIRNMYGLIGKWRSGAGSHKNKKKEAQRKACRGNTQEDG
jgi:hypothetical protein